jgi:hypothetical protein
MVPMYSARVADLIHHDKVMARCEACGHEAEVRVEAIWKKFPGFTRLQDVRLWCTRCGERRGVELDASRALGNDRGDDR